MDGRSVESEKLSCYDRWLPGSTVSSEVDPKSSIVYTLYLDAKDSRGNGNKPMPIPMLKYTIRRQPPLVERVSQSVPTRS